MQAYLAFLGAHAGPSPQDLSIDLGSADLVAHVILDNGTCMHRVEEKGRQRPLGGVGIFLFASALLPLALGIAQRHTCTIAGKQVRHGSEVEARRRIGVGAQPFVSMLNIGPDEFMNGS